MILPTSCSFSFAGWESHLQTGYNYLPESNVWWKIRWKNRNTKEKKRSCKHLKKSGMFFPVARRRCRRNTDIGCVSFCTFSFHSKSVEGFGRPRYQNNNKLRWDVYVKSRNCACVDNISRIASSAYPRHVGFTWICCFVDCLPCYFVGSYFWHDTNALENFSVRNYRENDKN